MPLQRPARRHEKLDRLDGKAKRYEKVAFLGEGQFATVYKATDSVQNGRVVAVKKIKIGSRQEAVDGINRTALREIKLLQELSHPNIIGLLDVFGTGSNISLVFDFMETDLEVIVKDTSIILTIQHIKAYTLQMLQGLEYLHANWVLHRDMKPNNLLLNDQGVLKIGDFGLAKLYGSPNRINTHQVVTRWYRCPELLFGARMYGTGVDMWAVGCIVAELLLRVPFLPGDSDLDQLSRIFQVTGTPNQTNWPHLKDLPDYVDFKFQPKQPLSHIFSAASGDLLHFLESCLKLDPLVRCTATEALEMDFFKNKPYATPYHLLPLGGANEKKNLKRKNDEAVDLACAKQLCF